MARCAKVQFMQNKKVVVISFPFCDIFNCLSIGKRNKRCDRKRIRSMWRKLSICFWMSNCPKKFCAKSSQQLKINPIEQTILVFLSWSKIHERNTILFAFTVFTFALFQYWFCFSYGIVVEMLRLTHTAVYYSSISCVLIKNYNNNKKY